MRTTVAADRSLLVRIIVTDDHVARDKVIRATNRQTAVPPASFRATDQIQRDLEQYFLQRDWFYERRKNYYRNQGRTAERVISIPYLAQAIMAIGLSEPSNSRARPSSLLKRDADYNRIFDDSLDYGVYLWAARTQRAVDAFLRSDAAATTASERTNLRFHLATLLVAIRNGGKIYNPSQLTGLTDVEFSDEEMATALKTVREALETIPGRPRRPDRQDCERQRLHGRATSRALRRPWCRRQPSPDPLSVVRA